MPKYNITNRSNPMPPPALDFVSHQSEGIREILGHSSISESIDIVFETSGDIDSMSLDTLNQKLRIMNSLSTGNDFLSAAKHVVRVREFWINRIRHSVERTDIKREFVENI